MKEEVQTREGLVAVLRGGSGGGWVGMMRGEREVGDWVWVKLGMMDLI